jgi:hypothetical protein
MTQNTFEKEIRKELDRLNRRIDEKIIRGLSYATEARRHKQLISRLRPARPSMFSFLTSIIF